MSHIFNSAPNILFETKSSIYFIIKAMCLHEIALKKDT